MCNIDSKRAGRMRKFDGLDLPNGSSTRVAVTLRSRTGKFSALIYRSNMISRILSNVGSMSSTVKPKK